MTRLYSIVFIKAFKISTVESSLLDQRITKDIAVYPISTIIHYYFSLKMQISISTSLAAVIATIGAIHAQAAAPPLGYPFALIIQSQDGQFDSESILGRYVDRMV